MAVSEEYFGAVGTWQTATTESNNQQFEFKVANWNPSDSTIGKGDYKYKFGELFNQTGEYVINLDVSTAYCAMDKDAPFVHRLYTSARYDSTHYHSRIDLAPTKDTPIGWYAGSIPTYMVILPEGYATDLAPVNFKPLWEDPAWHPTISTSNGQRTLGYIGSANSPVLSFPYKNIKLVPVVKCCAFKSGKTKTDLDDAVTATDFASVVDLSTEKFVPLGTYVNDSFSGTPFYEAFPVVCSLYVAPVLLYFDGNGDLAVPPGCTSKYNGTAMRNYGSMRETLHVDIFPSDKVDFTELISRYGTAYEDASCDARLFPTDKMPADHVYYGYNGNGYPSKSITVYGQGAFCIGGRCVGSAGNYNFMYPRAIDPDTFKVYADTDDADIACGITIEDFGTTDDFVEYVRKSVAYFGMFFSDDVEPAVEEKSTMDTVGLHLGIVDENGVTHGEYTTGDQNHTAQNYVWEDPLEDTPWTPGGGGGGEDPDAPEIADGFSPGVTSNGSDVGLKMYLVKASNSVDSLRTYFAAQMNYKLMLDAWGDAEVQESLPGLKDAYVAAFPDAASWTAYCMAMFGNGVNPLESIVSVMAYPFDTWTAFSHSLTADEPELGFRVLDKWYDYGQYITKPGTVVQDDYLLPSFDFYKLTQGGFHRFELCDDYLIEPFFGDFRDYEPYTRLELNVPYFGTFALAPSMWIGSTLKVFGYVELVTGSAVCIITRNGSPVFSAGAQLGVAVPMTIDAYTGTCNTWSAMSASYQSAKGDYKVGQYSALTDAVGSVVDIVSGNLGAAAGASSGGVTGAIGSAGSGIASRWRNLTAGNLERLQGLANQKRSLKATEYNMNHPIEGVTLLSTGSPSSSMRGETNCMLVRHRASQLPGTDVSQYGKTNGFACNKTGSLSSFSGYTQFTNVILDGIACTEIEKQQILSQLQAGVILKY